MAARPFTSMTIFGRKTDMIQPDPATGKHPHRHENCPLTQYFYDLDGNLTYTTDPNVHTTWTVYNALNRVRYTVAPWAAVPPT